MSHYSVTLPVPDDIYDCARPIAAGTSRLNVRKARAAALLTERGYPVTRAALSSADE